MPYCKFPFLVYQAGEMVTRLSEYQCYDFNGKSAGTRLGPPVSVFKLMGWGETMEEAEREARRNSVKFNQPNESPILQAQTPS